MHVDGASAIKHHIFTQLDAGYSMVASPELAEDVERHVRTCVLCFYVSRVAELRLMEIADRVMMR